MKTSRCCAVGALVLAVAGTAAIVGTHGDEQPTVAAVQARAVVAQWQPPAGLTAVPRSGSCTTGPLLRCFTTPARPDQALAAAGPSLEALGYAADTTDCGPTTTSFHPQLERFGTWRPCVTVGRAGQVHVTLDAFPIPVTGVLTHPAFTGTTVGLSAYVVRG